MNVHPTRRIRRNHGGPAGFTLIEILLVLTILVIMGAIAVPIVTGMGEKANIKAATVQVQMFEKAIDYYRLDMNKVPDSLEDLINTPSDQRLAKRWSGPYLPANRGLRDPWDNEYKYNPKGKNNPNPGGYDVWSMGPDGQDGTEDDIGNWVSDS